MVITRYKPFFSLSLSYELAGLGTRADGMSVVPSIDTEEKMYALRLKAKNRDNSSTIYFEGVEQPAGTPTTSEPIIEDTNDEFFYFLVYFSEKSSIKDLKFHSTANVASANGFPVFFDAKVVNPGAVPTISAREDVKVMPPVFSITVPKSVTGLTSAYATLEIRDEKNAVIDLRIAPVALNDKSIDGPGAVPEFSFSVDATRLEAGIYQFKVGTFTRKFFVASGMELGQAVCVIRVIKNNLLPYRKNLSDPAFTKFDLLIPKA